jgi:hypothetical protein
VVKTVDGKKYHWCIKHQAWTIHTPGNCHLNIKQPKDISADTSTTTVEAHTEQEPTLTMSTALKAIAERENTEWDDDDEASQDA